MMASGVSSSCTTHPGFEAIARCKQCGKPFCSKCQVKGPTGLFCCAECKDSHEAFTARAQGLDSMSRESTFVEKIKLTVRKFTMIALFVLIVATVLHFVGVNIPVLSDQIRSIMNK
jgi:hypothetical protein